MSSAQTTNQLLAQDIQVGLGTGPRSAWNVDSDPLTAFQTPVKGGSTALTPYCQARYVSLDKKTDQLVSAIEGKKKDPTMKKKSCK